MEYKWKTKNLGEATVVEIGGEIDLHNAPALKKALVELVEAQTQHIALDLSEVSFLDSTGIGALVGAFKAARETGASLVFFGARARVKRVFEITGLLKALPFFESRDAALAALLPIPPITEIGATNG